MPGQFEHPHLCEIVAKAEAKILAHSEVALGGIAFSSDDARAMIARGYRFIVLGSDAGLVPARRSAWCRPSAPETKNVDKEPACSSACS